jgi:hypothetical protein
MKKTTMRSNQQQQHAFTLAELLAVLGVLALLTATLLPALAMGKGNSRLAQCLANLRQIGAGCAMYADDFNGWYPITSVGAANDYAIGSVNHLLGIHYTRYIYLNDSGAIGEVMPRFMEPSINPSMGFRDQNLGYLYADGLVSDGYAFFCPAYSNLSPSAPDYYRDPDYYSTPQFMSTQANGAIRSDYMFNPRMKDAAGYPNSGDILRRYQKTSDVKSRDVFTIDYLGQAGSGTLGNSPVGVPFTPDNWAHWPGKGLNALFTDGSARFCTLTNSAFFNGVVHYLVTDETATSAIQYDELFNALRDSP